MFIFRHVIEFESNQARIVQKTSKFINKHIVKLPQIQKRNFRAIFFYLRIYYFAIFLSMWQNSYFLM